MDFDFSFLAANNYPELLLGGALNTFRLFAGAWVLGMFVALMLAGLRSVPNRALQSVISLFIEYHRNVPTVVQIMVWYFGVPEILPVDLRRWINRGDGEMVFAMIALSLNVSAFWCEDIRSGLRAVSPTQTEAARSIGLSAVGALRYVLLPQAVRNAIPAITNRTLILFKDTSLAMAIGVTELTYQVKAIENLSFRSFEVFTVATLFYLGSSVCLMTVGLWLGRKFPPAAKG